MERNITIKDIATMCGVSVKTVSRVLNGSNQVKSETKEKILEIMREKGYRANILAQGLRNKKTNIIVVFVDKHKNKYWGMWHTKLMASLFVEAKQHGQKIIITPSSATGHIDDETDGFHLLANKMADGAILLDNTNNDVRLQFLNRQKIPYVLVGQTDDRAVTWVDADNYNIGKLGCSHLIQKGYRKICFLLGQKQFNVNTLRASGFEEIARQNKIDYKIVYDVDSMSAVHDTVISVRKEFEFDALFISGSERTVGAYRALNEMNQRIPEDVSVLGIDDLSICKYLYPSMSVIDQHCDAFAKSIIDKLAKIINGTCDIEEKTTFIPSTIVQREST